MFWEDPIGPGIVNWLYIARVFIRRHYNKAAPLFGLPPFSLLYCQGYDIHSASFDPVVGECSEHDLLT